MGEKLNATVSTFAGKFGDFVDGLINIFANRVKVIQFCLNFLRS